ncbi:MAG: hypothetical protein ACI94Y_000483 [Maribacter sp.]|jgi:hypothetical protein
MQLKVSRQELNRRFKSIYEELVSRKEIVKNNRQKSKSAFATNLGTKSHIINLYLNDKRQITYDQVKLLCTKYGISEVYMFQGIGKPFDVTILPSPEKRLCMALGIDFSPNILFTNVEAFASNTVGVDLWEQNERFRIPGIKGDLVAFYINGDSMKPTIDAGDMVICSPVDIASDLDEEEVYAIVSNSCVWVKRVQKCYDRRGVWTHFRLISDNSDEFDPFIIENSEVHSLLKVTRRITGLK